LESAHSPLYRICCYIISIVVLYISNEPVAQGK
jgi:hypothetical protein